MLELVKDKDYFVLTTNVDHCFQKAGFDKKRIFYTQGYQIDTTGELTISEGTIPKRAIPSELVPHCPHCGKPLTMNLRADDTFVEDEGWHQAAERYYLFRQRHEKLSIVYLELGGGYNTPGIIKYPFWQMTAANPKATYICLNYGQAAAPAEIQRQSICIDGNIGEILQ